MNKNPFENEYLRKKVENDERIELPSYFERQFLPYEYSINEGIAILEKNDFRLTLKYKSFERDNKSGKVNQKDQDVLDTISEQISLYGDTISTKDLSKQIKILNDLSIEKGNTSFRVYDILPRGYRILFLPSLSTTSFLSPEDRFVFIGDDILTPIGLLALGHELGHIQDFSRLSESDMEKALHSVIQFGFLVESSSVSSSFSKKKIESISENVLRQERNAWAFAFLKLRYFFDDLNIDKKDVFTLIHKNTLEFYSSEIRKIIGNLE